MTAQLIILKKLREYLKLLITANQTINSANQTHHFQVNYYREHFTTNFSHLLVLRKHDLRL